MHHETADRADRQSHHGARHQRCGQQERQTQGYHRGNHPASQVNAVLVHRKRHIAREGHERQQRGGKHQRTQGEAGGGRLVRGLGSCGRRVNQAEEQRTHQVGGRGQERPEDIDRQTARGHIRAGNPQAAARERHERQDEPQTHRNDRCHFKTRQGRNE